MICFNGRTMTGNFVRRINRFLAEVEMFDEIKLVHVPNTGRMKELLINNTKVLCSEANNTKRKTKYDLVAVETKRTWMAIDSRLPNLLIKYGIENEILKDFTPVGTIKSEISFGSSRFDLGISNDYGHWLIENKCCTFVEENVAKFPDAPTVRGTRHMYELQKAIEMGINAAVFFVIQCNYAECFRPNDYTDPNFGKALRDAHDSGVKVYAYNCYVNTNGIMLNNQIPIML